MIFIHMYTPVCIILYNYIIYFYPHDTPILSPCLVLSAPPQKSFHCASGYQATMTEFANDGLIESRFKVRWAHRVMAFYCFVARFFSKIKARKHCPLFFSLKVKKSEGY